MASKKTEAEKVSIGTVVPPPQRRKAKGPSLDKSICEAMFKQMNNPTENGYPYIGNGIDYDTMAKAQAQALRYRKAFAGHGIVDEKEALTSTCWAVTRDPETGDKSYDDEGNEIGPFRFALAIADPE